MGSKRLNVLIYSGDGSTVESVRHCIYTLRNLLSPYYAVYSVSSEAIVKEPWTASCALLVLPGGADLGYCRTLNGDGNRRIRQYLRRGGRYFGFCAGGYYGCAKCEFEVGNDDLEVVGSRELALFPGICRGLAFPGFVYHSEAGARAVELKVNRPALATVGGSVPQTFRTYYNGGGVFVDAEKHISQGVEVLASYTEKLHVDAGQGAAAVVYCKIAEGAAILTGPHPEFAAVNLSRSVDDLDYLDLIDTLTEQEKPRTDFMRACLSKLGLRVNQDNSGMPSLSSLHLSSAKASDVFDLASRWQDMIELIDGQEYVKGENDTFLLKRITDRLGTPVEDRGNSTLSDLERKEPENRGNDSDEGIVDYDSVIKLLMLHSVSLPDGKHTSYFDHSVFFSSLCAYHGQESPTSNLTFGKYLLYGDVVTSTNTILEKNPTLLSRLPSGLTATAATQVAGRGRGNNVWVSPPGSLMFSTVLRHPLSSTQRAPVVFVQYLAALAVVEGIRTYNTSCSAYARLPVKLKWPNDIYALDPTAGKDPNDHSKYVKIGGILVNSSYSGGDYTLVAGVGLNVTNLAPTTSLNALLPENTRPFTLEKLLARILSRFERLHLEFCRTGWDRRLEELYYKNWLHTDQVITIDAEGGARARIKGITRDWGLLLAEELGWQDQKTGRSFVLNSDGNSFDFFNGLIRRKV